jgi:protein TonB
MPLLIMMLLLSAVAVSGVPKNQILVKGAVPSASDPSTPVPETGRIGDGRYRNAYFGLTYPIPAGWTEQPAGPPPSDAGGYVLTQFASLDGQRVKAHVLVTAQDLFFIPFAAASAKDVAAKTRSAVAEQYELEKGPDEVTIAGRTFQRLAYKASPASGLHWRMFTTEARCHALTFTFTGTDTKLLDEAEKVLSNLHIDNNAPACINDYARDHVVAKTTPEFTQRYNTILVRVIIDAEGKVRHIHLLSAFPEQSQPILTALREWRFKPYMVDGKAVEVETGMVFGLPRLVVR